MAAPAAVVFAAGAHEDTLLGVELVREVAGVVEEEKLVLQPQAVQWLVGVVVPA